MFTVVGWMGCNLDSSRDGTCIADERNIERVSLCLIFLHSDGLTVSVHPISPHAWRTEPKQQSLCSLNHNRPIHVLEANTQRKS